MDGGVEEGCWVVYGCEFTSFLSCLELNWEREKGMGRELANDMVVWIDLGADEEELL